MSRIAYARRHAVALALVGVAFFIAGVEQRRSGGSGAFVLIGFVFVVIGLRRLRRVAPELPD